MKLQRDLREPNGRNNGGGALRNVNDEALGKNRGILRESFFLLFAVRPSQTVLFVFLF